MQILVIRVMDSRLAHPFTCIVSGPTGSGKSVFTLKLIEHPQKSISPPPKRIRFCYGEYQKIFDNYPGVEFHDGKSTFMTDAFKNATSAPYGYLLIDLKQETDDKLRLRTGIFTGDVQYVYLRK